MHPVEMNSLFGQQGSWKGTSKIIMMAVLEEQKKCRSIANLEITSTPALQGSFPSLLDLILVSAAYTAFLFPKGTSKITMMVIFEE
jgi:hypothetical protein